MKKGDIYIHNEKLVKIVYVFKYDAGHVVAITSEESIITIHEREYNVDTYYSKHELKKL